MTDLVIHALECMGGSLALCQMPGRTGDYPGDLEFIRDWKPSIVISASTRGEMVDAGAETLSSDILASGARWMPVPITDYDVPDDKALELWKQVSALSLSALRGKGRVLVHCKGGCGRSGMLALRLMVMAGEDAVEALLRLRRVRPCAVETEAQLRWAVTGQLI